MTAGQTVYRVHPYTRTLQPGLVVALPDGSLGVVCRGSRPGGADETWLLELTTDEWLESAEQAVAPLLADAERGYRETCRRVADMLRRVVSGGMSDG